MTSLPCQNATLMTAVKDALNPFNYVRGCDSMDGRKQKRALAKIGQELDSGGNPSICDSGLNFHATTPIIVASAHRNFEILALLLASPLADVNVVDSKGNTALLVAARNANPRNIEALLDAGANAEVQNADGMTPLMLAISSELYESCALLAQRACWDWVDADNSGTTLRELAADASKRPGMGNIMHLLTSIMDERALLESCPLPSQELLKRRSL